ncbi:MAG: DUF4349 domain-containing protein [Solirubrobacteraceae bacterium]
MRSVDVDPIDPRIATSLDAIDAAIAGEPVDPRQAELAELAVLLTAQRPQMPAPVARSLDQRLTDRFGAPGRSRRRWTATSRRWRLAPLAGAMGAVLVGVIAVAVVLSSGGPALPTPNPHNLSVSASGTAASARKSAASQASAARGARAPARPTSVSPVPGPRQPPAGGRKIIQSAQLALTTPPNRIDDVAQGVFDVVGAQNGIVNNSNVTATGGQDGSGQFQLSVPSSRLSATMSALSQLRYAAVASRTDATQDAGGRFADAGRRLADARALRTSLLARLSNATTQQQIDSLRTQIRDADASISGDEAALRGLNREVDYSRLDVTINAGAGPASGGSSFSIGHAAHDAGRVLTVAAGVALIGLAGLVPVGLIAALVWWIAVTLRRRRREQALDTA